MTDILPAVLWKDALEDTNERGLLVSRKSREWSEAFETAAKERNTAIVRIIKKEMEKYETVGDVSWDCLKDHGEVKRLCLTYMEKHYLHTQGCRLENEMVPDREGLRMPHVPF